MLERLHLHNNQLTALPEHIGFLTGLTELTLHSNQLASLPQNLSSLQGLWQLNLHDNLLISLPECVAKMNLKELDVSRNMLRELPPFLSKLCPLEVLQLNGNKLKTLPDSIALFRNLQCLELQDNKLRSLPENLVQLNKLRKLNLASNALESLPSTLGQMTRLEFLDLNGNYLSALPASVLEWFRNSSLLPPDLEPPRSHREGSGPSSGDDALSHTGGLTDAESLEEGVVDTVSDAGDAPPTGTYRAGDAPSARFTASPIRGLAPASSRSPEQQQRQEVQANGKPAQYNRLASTSSLPDSHGKSEAPPPFRKSVSTAVSPDWAPNGTLRRPSKESGR